MIKFIISENIHGRKDLRYKDMVLWTFADDEELDDLAFTLTAHQVDMYVYGDEDDD